MSQAGARHWEARRLAAWRKSFAALPRCGKPKRDGAPCRAPLRGGKCLTHDTMTPEARTKLCQQIAVLGGIATPTGEQSPRWKGDQAKASSGRKRAQRAYAARACERCGAQPEGRGQLHRHHRDGNTRNNARSNIEILCQTCHAAEHGGNFVWFEHG